MISFDRVADIYDATRGYPPEVADRIADALARHFRAADATPRVIEPGVGTGRMAVPLAARGIRVAGVDIARGMLAVLRDKTPPVPAALARADALPFRANAFDGALLVHLLHLVPDAPEVVREVCRVVRPGGVVVSGGDDAPVGLMRDVMEALRAAGRGAGADVAGWDGYRRALESTRRVLEEAGAALRSERLASWQAEITARELLERTRRRVNSQTWPLSDDQLAALLERATPALERLCGGLDRPRAAERGFCVSVARLPESGQEL